MPKMANLASFFKLEVCGQTVLPDTFQSDKNWRKMSKLKNSNATFWGIFKHCAWRLSTGGNDEGSRVPDSESHLDPLCQIPKTFEFPTSKIWPFWLNWDPPEKILKNYKYLNFRVQKCFFSIKNYKKKLKK